MGREPIHKRLSAFFPKSCDLRTLSGISGPFGPLSRTLGQVAHVLLTRSPLALVLRPKPARLACLRHAASVRPEPGSNSPLHLFLKAAKNLLRLLKGSWLFFFQPLRCSVFKDRLASRLAFWRAPFEARKGYYSIRKD